MCATSAQYSAEMLLASGGADKPCGSGNVGAGCKDVGGNLTRIVVHSPREITYSLLVDPRVGCYKNRHWIGTTGSDMPG